SGGLAARISQPASVGTSDQLSLRMQLGGSPNISEKLPNKPKGMHWQTFERLRRAHDVVEARSMMGLMRYIDSRDRRVGARHLQRSKDRPQGFSSGSSHAGIITWHGRLRYAASVTSWIGSTPSCGLRQSSWGDSIQPSTRCGNICPASHLRLSRSTGAKRWV